MALLFDSWLIELVAVLVTLFAGVYVYFLISFQFWKKQGIQQLAPTFPFGNTADVAMGRLSVGHNYKKLYQEAGDAKYAGFYQFYLPSLLIKDPEYIRAILVKDFAYFHDRGIVTDPDMDPLLQHLFTLKGPKWRSMRMKLTPTFTSGKMKMMFPTVEQCARELKEYLEESAKAGKTLEVKDIMSKFTTDVIATCVFGIQSNSLKNPNSEFRNMGKRIFNTTFVQRFRFFIGLTLPKIAAMSKVRLLPLDVSNFFLGVVRETMEYREKNGVTRNDFMQLLIALKNNKVLTKDDEDDVKKEEEVHPPPGVGDDASAGLRLDQAAAQAFVFFVAGFETSSTTISFSLYELAMNLDVQQKLRDEIDRVTGAHGGKITYESLHEMDYLDRVVAETLRKYPPAPLLIRKCTKEYKLPGTDATIEPDMTMVIPTLGIHHDPQYYPNPDQFDPERFTAEAKKLRPHFTYLPFGEGPRTCIGSRFGLMQSKIGLASLISEYQFSVCPKSTIIPIQMDSQNIILTAKNGINLKITVRD